MNRFFRLSASLVATAALSGCASVFGYHGFAERGKVEAPAPVQPAQENAELALARQAMDAGRTADAIDHFRAAQMDPAALPAASNGLAVAYVRLGRLDLADRYFHMAMALDPTNQRYAANMLRLQNDYALAQASAPAAPQLAEAQPPAASEPAAPRPAEVAAADEPGAIERISRGEVHIRTIAAPAPAPRIVVASRDPLPSPILESLSATNGPTTVDVSYPVRIDLSKRAGPGGGKAKAAAYPQRIDLAKVAEAN